MYFFIFYAASSIVKCIRTTLHMFTMFCIFQALFGFFLLTEMKATLEEMESAKLPLNARDYCAHLAIQNRACRQKVWPFTYKCAHEKHEYLNCQYDE